MNALHVFILLTVGSFHLTTRKMYNGLNIIRQQQISSKYSAWQRVTSFTNESRWVQIILYATLKDGEQCNSIRNSLV